MYSILRIILCVSIALIIGVIVNFFIDIVEVKKNPGYYLKSHRKFLLKMLLIGIGGLIVSGTFLLFKMY